MQKNWYSWSVQWVTTQYLQLKGSVKELNKFHNYETDKITRKASDAAEYYRVVLPPEIVMQDALNVILWTSVNICGVHDDLG